MNEEHKEIISKVIKLQKDVALFFTKILGISTLEQYHKDICKAVVEFDRLAIKACHAVGKTWIMGNVVLWFITCFKNSIVITTAPTNRQVEALLWGEIRKGHRRSKTRLGGKLLRKRLDIDDDWYAMGFSPSTGAASDSEEQQGSAFQGFHAKHVLIIFDEATGIPRDLWVMAEGLLTSGVTVKWICIANPTTTACEFYKVCRKAEWHVMTINCFDSPNMIANGFNDIEDVKAEIDILKTLSDYDRLQRIRNYKKPNDYLLNAQWVMSKLYDWGFEHPLSKSKILGEFPTQSDNVIVKYDSVMNAFNRDPITEYSKRYIGVDVARFGDDLTVITEITDVSVREKYVHMHLDIMETTGHVMQLFSIGNQGKETHIAIDATGVGSGVVDALRENKREGLLPDYCYIHEIHFGNKISIDGKLEKNKSEAQKKTETKLNNTYENLKAYMFELLNKDLNQELCLPNEEIYEEELPTILFTYSRKNKLCVENKKDYKARTGKSPDTSDSLVLANYARYLKPNHVKFTRRKESAKPFHKTYGANPRREKERKDRIKVKSF